MIAPNDQIGGSDMMDAVGLVAAVLTAHHRNQSEFTPEDCLKYWLLGLTDVILAQEDPDAAYEHVTTLLKVGYEAVRKQQTGS